MPTTEHDHPERHDVAPADTTPARPDDLAAALREAARRQAELGAQHLRTIETLRRLLGDFTADSIRIHGRNQAALDALAVDVARMKRQLARLSTARRT